MRLAISNIAWNVSEDEEIVRLLPRYDVDAIDVAPGKYFPDPVKASDRDIANTRMWWADRGIEITGMQSLLFGTVGLNIFDSTNVQEAMLAHLAAICRIGAGLGATRLVFGSPKNRDRSKVADDEVMEIAIPFFRRLGDIAERHGVLICLEPNPVCYGANFMTTSAETAQVVEDVAHAAIKMQLDTGAITINEEDVDSVLDRYAHLIGHVHASEPGLVPLGDGETDHGKVYSALKRHLPTALVSIEMLATEKEPHLVSIERALAVAADGYGIS
ncbi:MAG: sugar phosphate isomerase/epimerase [Planctomycetia bacterium]|nr:sugar phosphate isomerase/epimerase [Planctomycetia bacterium]